MVFSADILGCSVLGLPTTHGWQLSLWTRLFPWAFVLISPSGSSQGFPVAPMSPNVRTHPPFLALALCASLSALPPLLDAQT